MIRGDFHPLDQIETVRIKSLHTGIELEIVATLGLRLLHKPIEKLAAETAGSIVAACDQIIDIKKFSSKERIQKTITRDRAHLAARLQEREQISAALLMNRLLQEFIRAREMRPQLTHDRITAPDLRPCLGNRDSRGFPFRLHAECVSRLPSYHRPRRLRERAAFGPPAKIDIIRHKTRPPEYMRNLRPEVITGSRKTLKRSRRFKAKLK